GATARLRSSSLKFGDKASDPDRRPRASTALRFTGGRGRPGPGLFDRGIGRKRNGDGGVLWGRVPDRRRMSIGVRPDETSAVDVSGQHPCRASGRSGTSSNVVISREKFSSNLRV